MVFHVDRPEAGEGFVLVTQGTPVPAGSATAALNASPERVQAAETDSGKGRLNDWMGGERNYKVTEEVAGLGQYGRTLTVLTCEALSMRAETDESDEEEDEQDLVERWSPRFRR